MTTAFPSGLDALTNPAASDAQSAPSHAGQHSDINDAMEAVQAKVGANTSAVTTSLDYLVKTAADPGHTHGTGSAPGSAASLSNIWAATTTAQLGSVICRGDNILFTMGIFGGSAAATGSTAAGVDNNGTFCTQTSGSVSGNAASAVFGNSRSMRLGQAPFSFLLKFRASDYTSIRLFVGLTGALSAGTELAADAAANSKLGLMFSTVRPDTAFQFVRSDGATQTLTSTGVTPVADTVYLLRIAAATSSSVTFTLLSSAGASLAASTVSTLLPAASDNLAIQAGVATQTGSGRAITLYYAQAATNAVALA